MNTLMVMANSSVSIANTGLIKERAVNKEENMTIIDEPYIPCKYCKGEGYNKVDPSNHCVMCKGTGDGRHVFVATEVGGIWRGTYPQKPTGGEKKLAIRQNILATLILLVLFLTIAAVIWYQFTYLSA
jgi:hypothetical protein